MCGIVGIINDNKLGAFTKELQVFKSLLIVDSLRGAHATGIIGVDVDGSADYRKINGDPFSLFRAQHENVPVDTWAFDSQTRWRALIGHNRFATTGGRETAHAHPFHHGDIMMVHNGTLNNNGTQYSLKKFDVDSECFAYAMNEYGIKEAIEKTAGAIATVVYNLKDRRIYFYRNYERPLYMGYDKFMGKAMFASELQMLHMVCARESWTQMKFTALRENTLNSVSIDDLKDWKEEAVYSRRGKQVHQQHYSADYSADYFGDYGGYEGSWSERGSTREVKPNNVIPLPAKLPEQQQQLQQPTSSKAKYHREWNQKLLEGSLGNAQTPKQEDSKSPILSKKERLKQKALARNEKKHSKPFAPSDWQTVPAINGLVNGNTIIFTPHDIIEQGPTKRTGGAFLIEGRSDDMPSLKIRYWCDSQEEADVIIGASYLRAKVKNLLWYTKNDREPNTAYDIAWVDNPVPVDGMEDNHQGAIH